MSMHIHQNTLETIDGTAHPKTENCQKTAKKSTMYHKDGKTQSNSMPGEGRNMKVNGIKIACKNCQVEKADKPTKQLNTSPLAYNWLPSLPV